MVTQLTNSAGRTESNVTRSARVRREVAVIQRARSEIASGEGIDDDALEAWLDALDGNPNAPLPRSGSAKP